MASKYPCDIPECEAIAFVSHSGEYQDKSFCKAHFFLDIKKTERIFSIGAVKPSSPYIEKR